MSFRRGLLLVAAPSPEPSSRLLLTMSMSHFSPSEWDCLLLVSHSGEAPISRCSLLSRSGWRSASLLNLSYSSPSLSASLSSSLSASPSASSSPSLTTSLSPTLLPTRAYSHVFVLLGDVYLPRHAVHLPRLLRLMERHSLAVISPAIAGGVAGEITPAQFPTGGVAANQCVRQVEAVELGATLFTEPAWRCFTSMFDAEVRAHPTRTAVEGYDRCFKARCGRLLGGARMGVFLGQIAVHLEGPLPELRRRAGEEEEADRAFKSIARGKQTDGFGRWGTETWAQARHVRELLDRVRQVQRDSHHLAAGYTWEYVLLSSLIARGENATQSMRAGDDSRWQAQRQLEDISHGVPSSSAVYHDGTESLTDEEQNTLDDALRLWVRKTSGGECAVRERRMPKHFGIKVPCMAQQRAWGGVGAGQGLGRRSSRQGRSSRVPSVDDGSAGSAA